MHGGPRLAILSFGMARRIGQSRTRTPALADHRPSAEPAIDPVVASGRTCVRVRRDGRRGLFRSVEVTVFGGDLREAPAVVVFDAGAPQQPQDAPATIAAGAGSTRPKLTRAQRVVADLAARGRSIAEIAERLQRSANTVRAHLKRLYRVLGVSNRAELACRIMAGDAGRREESGR